MSLFAGGEDELVWAHECANRGHVHPDCAWRGHNSVGTPAYESFLASRGPLNPRRVARLA